MKKTSFIQKIFSEISLEKDPEFWQDDEDSEEKNIQRIRFISEFDECRYIKELDASTSSCRKNANLAQALKEKGNYCYKNKDCFGALNHYNKALLFASGGDISILIGNRSAIWFDIGEFESVNQDVQSAFSFGYPDTLAYKLYERRAKSKFALKDTFGAKEDIKLSLKYLDTSKMEEKLRDNKKQELSTILNSLENSVEKQKTLSEHEEYLTLANPNPRFPNFSNAVKIEYATGRGRYAVAERDIEIGELLAADQAFVAAIDQEYSRTNCTHCLKQAKCPLPCESCSGVVFCSLMCRDTAMKTYHKYECLFTDQISKANIGAWRLGYKALTSYPWSFFIQNKDIYLSRNEKAGLESDFVYSSKDLHNFHSLVTHDGVGDKNAPELMMQAHVAVFLLRLLKKTGYFPNEVKGFDLSDDEILAGSILHHFMRAAFFNTHEMTQVFKCDENWDSNKLIRIGRVTNPSLALINHSCDPNYRRVSKGTTTYGFAVKTIRKGEEITDIYCDPFSVSDLQTRHSRLKKYNFTCNCVPCKHNWLTMEQVPSQVDGLHPKSYKMPQNKIQNQVKRISRAEEKFSAFFKNCEHKLAKTKEEQDEIKKLIISILNEYDKVLNRPHQSIIFWENQLHNILIHSHSAKVVNVSRDGTTLVFPTE